MPVIVTIENLKSIKRMIFDIPMQGAYVLTGANGCGKTSLLIALHRMGAHNAFQTGLPGAKKSADIDGLEDARIAYEINGKSVAYRYNNTRWSATPKSNSALVSHAFREVLFLKADASRVEPTPSELKGVRKLAADPALKLFLNEVFDTKKFDNLLKINLRGRNAIAHLIDRSAPGAKRKIFYSEKNFSLGELCVMRLAQKLLSAKNGALYIIDEFEMALHPAAQIRLFEQIRKLTDSVNCTALVSTHSSSLIKSVKRGNIIYLENEAGNVTVHRNVYPTYALQHLALDEETSPDKLIFVEDISAKYCIEAMWKKFIGSQANQSLPAAQTVVIGGFKEVLRFLDRSPSFVPSITKCLAALDADAEPLCIASPAAVGKFLVAPTAIQTLYKKLNGRVVFLPWTPEVGLCELLREDLATHLGGIKVVTGLTALKITQGQADAHHGLKDRALRERCKKTVEEIAEAVAEKKSCTVERATEDLLFYLVEATIKKEKTLMTTLSNKMFA